MTILKASLTLKQLELELHLGHYEAERQTKQKVWIDIELIFSAPPSACSTDQLENTVCYETLSNILHEQLSPHVFQLIEHLAYRIYSITKNICGNSVSVSIAVTKKPQLAFPNAGSCFKYGDC